MAVTRRSTTPYQYTTEAASHTISVTVASGSDLCLLVGTAVQVNTANRITGITYNGDALTELIESASDAGINNVTASLWYLLTPDVGTFDLIVTLVAADSLSLAAHDLAGVDQSTPFGTADSAIGSSTAPSVVVTSASGELVFDMIAARGSATASTLTADSGQTEHHDAGPTSSTSTGVYGGSSSEAGAASVTMSWTLSTTRAWAIAAAPVLPATGGGVALAGTTAASSTSIGKVSQTRPIAVLTTGTSTSVATLTVVAAGGLAGQSPAVSTTVGKLSVSMLLAVVSVGTSASTGALSQTRPLAGFNVATSTTVGTLSQTRPLAGLTAAVSTTVGFLRKPGNWQVTINGVDRTSYVRPFNAVRIVNRTHAGSGTATIPIWDETGALTISNEQEVEVTQRGTRLFRGIVRGKSRSDLGWSTGPRIYSLECQDFTTLLDDDVIEEEFRTTTESDKSRITYLVNTYGTRGVTAGTEVQQLIATLPAGGPELDFSGKTLREAIEQVIETTGASYYVDYNKKLHYFLTESPVAPYGLSDAYNGTTTVAFSDLQLDDDSIDLKHEVLVVGEDIKVWRDVSDIGGSLPPIGTRRRGVIRDTNVVTTEQANAVGDAFLTRYGAVHDSGTVNTRAAGFRAGQTVAITHTGMGLAATSFSIASVTATTLSGEEVNFALELNDPQLDMADLVLAQRKILEATRQAAQDARDEEGQPIGGRNLIANSSFENADTNGWAVGAGWTFGFTVSDAFHGSKTARLVRSAATGGDLISPIVQVDRDELYSVSYRSFLRSRSLGTARVELREYNNSDTLLATTTLTDLVAAQTKWTRYSFRFAPNRNQKSLAFHASTTRIRLVMRTTGSSTLTWDTDGWQIEQGKPTDYRPKPAEVGDGQIGGDQIEDGAIDAPKIVDNAITSTKITSGAVTTPKLAANSVTANEIATNAITTIKIAADAITSAKIAAGTITATELAADSVTATKIASGSISTDQLIAGQVAIKGPNGVVILDPDKQAALQVEAQWQINLAGGGAGTQIASVVLAGWPNSYGPFILVLVNQSNGWSYTLPSLIWNTTSGVVDTYYYARSLGNDIEVVRTTRVNAPGVTFRVLAVNV